jgi:ABC-2 type transport system ATP-binding protein
MGGLTLMIELKGITKEFKSLTAVDNLDLKIEKGEIFGLLGPNGAGKTTTIRMLTTLARPTSGQVLINGFDLNRELAQVKAQIGVVQQHMNVDIELTVWENLELHGRLHKMPKAERRQRIDELLEFIEMKDRAEDRAAVLSGGMKRKLMITRALMHKPKILFLDEPTVGLDVHSRRKMWDLIRKMNEMGLTVLLTTHYIEEAEALCHRVGLIDQGKLITLGTPDELKQQVGKIVVESLTNGTTDYQFFPDREAAASVAGNLEGKVIIREANLEDVFVKLTNHKVGE